MTVLEFIAEKKQHETTMCAAIIYPDGTIAECINSHLKTMIADLGDDIWDCIPKDASPLFYLTGYMGVVLVDYENQLYSERLTDEQQSSLQQMYDEHVIMNHLCNVHSGNKVMGIPYPLEKK